MDELNIVRKGSRTWLWVIGLIVLAAIVWAIVAMSGNRNANPASRWQPTPGEHAPAIAERLAKL